MLKKIVVITAALFATQAIADEAGVKKAFEAAYPKMRVESVTKTPYAGLYEIFANGQIVYSDEKLNFLIAEGRLVDVKSKRDVTSERLDELTKIDFNSLPLDQAIKVVKGNGSRKVAVFSDPDCPYCKRLEQQELVNINDVTIYTFLFPLEQLHPDAANKAKSIWCAQDKGKAWTDWVLNNQLPAKAADTCTTPIDKLSDLGKKLGVVSTPTLFFTDGKRMLGAYPADQIEKAINNASTKK